MPRHGDIDYPTLTKRGVLLGISLFVGGMLGELAIHTAGITVPGWEETVLFDIEVLGVLLTLLCPFVCGILLPLTE